MAIQLQLKRLQSHLPIDEKIHDTTWQCINGRRQRGARKPRSDLLRSHLHRTCKGILLVAMFLPCTSPQSAHAQLTNTQEALRIKTGLRSFPTLLSMLVPLRFSAIHCPLPFWRRRPYFGMLQWWWSCGSLQHCTFHKHLPLCADQATQL